MRPPVAGPDMTRRVPERKEIVQPERRIDLERAIIPAPDRHRMRSGRKVVDAVAARPQGCAWLPKMRLVPEVDSRLVADFHRPREIAKDPGGPLDHHIFGLVAEVSVVEVEDI